MRRVLVCLGSFTLCSCYLSHGRPSESDDVVAPPDDPVVLDPSVGDPGIPIDEPDDPSAPDLPIVCDERGPIGPDPALNPDRFVCRVVPGESELALAGTELDPSGDVVLARGVGGDFLPGGTARAICEARCGQNFEGRRTEWHVGDWRGETPAGTTVEFSFGVSTHRSGAWSSLGVPVASGDLPLDLEPLLLEHELYGGDYLSVEARFHTDEPSSTPIFGEFSIEGLCVDWGCAGQCSPGALRGTRSQTCGDGTVWSQQTYCGANCRWRTSAWARD